MDKSLFLRRGRQLSPSQGDLKLLAKNGILGLKS